MTKDGKVSSHNDDPILRDAFGQQGFIERIAHIIRDCHPPKGIGVNGYWGTGKTSTLMRIYYHLSGKHPFIEKPDLTMVDAPVPKDIQQQVVPIWFEAWRYQHESLPIVALLNEIREQMGLMEKFRNATGKILGVTLLGSLSAFDEVIKAASGGLVKPGLGKIQGIGEKWEAERHMNPLPGQAIKNLLENAVEQALGKNKRLVIFIDDLDRCTPDAALRLLEGIKVYLNLKNCVIVFGMDQRQIERALISALNLDSEKDPGYSASSQAREYLEKICQDIYHLPQPDKSAKAEYFLQLLRELDLGAHSDAHIDNLGGVLLEFDCLPANPRKIKALANRSAGLLLEWISIEPPSGPKVVERRYSVLMAMTIIYCFHRRVYEQLQKNPGYINEVVNWATHEQPEDLINEPLYFPMKNIVPSIGKSGDLPVNPSDSNVFRLHQLFARLKSLSLMDIIPFLNR
ncbi:MAG: KAP family NTPase [Desulfobulbaceae bacterium]|nr:KAP family NTPase [Desulfobulbaceae bacterium]